MLYNKIIDFWGYDNLKRWPERNLCDVSIPQSSKRFLVEVGLPRNQDWTLRFDDELDELPRLPTKASCRRIGFDDVVPICLDERRSGCVVAADTGACGEERFINTNVESFGEFLILYQEYRTTARMIPEQEIMKFIPGIEERMRKVDSKAFDDTNNYWPVIIEQMNQGLL